MNTEETLKLVQENGVVTMQADKTRDNAAADALLERLGNKARAIPFVAIFPAGQPQRPILLDGPLTEGTVLEALRKAGPSRPNPVTAMRSTETK